MNLKVLIETYGDSFPYPVSLVDHDASDRPVIYVNNCFRSLTGYGDEDILGRNCRFLQAGKSVPASNLRMRTAIDARLPICQDLINFKKNGEIFYNRLVMIPFRIRNEKFYLGLQHEIPEDKYQPENEVPHNDLMDRTINPLSILITLETSGDQRFGEEFQKMIKKIQGFVFNL